MTLLAVDAHVHLWCYDAAELDWISDQMAVLKRDFVADELAREFAAGGVRGGVAGQARSSLAETDFLLAQQATSSAILGVVGWVEVAPSWRGAPWRS